ncbi:MAG: prepilin peptidase [Lachnospiraceae bacterium]|nr:prepilin peptidase [Lachnospiraceae bacterium]
MGVASFQDIKTRRIPNWYWLTGWLLGVISRLWSGGLSGVLDWACGAAGTFFFSILGYLCGGIGASDVKLLSVAGGFLGERAIFFLPVHTLLFAGVMSVIYLIRQRRLIHHLRDLARMIPEVLCGSCLLPVSKTRIPLVPCILGAVILWFLKGGGH